MTMQERQPIPNTNVHVSQKGKGKMPNASHSPNSQCSEDPMGVNTPLAYRDDHLPGPSKQPNVKVDGNILNQQRAQIKSEEPFTTGISHQDKRWGQNMLQS
jgi:hypothetical protein